jgi:hypothetical protein
VFLTPAAPVFHQHHTPRMRTRPRCCSCHCASFKKSCRLRIRRGNRPPHRH